MVFLWLIVCVCAVLIELMTPTALITIWFAVGAIIGALASLVNLPIYVQVICFAIVSFVSMLVVRPIAAHYLRGNIVPTNADRFIGEFAWVSKEISKEEWGEVKIKGMIWHAIPIDDVVIKEKEKVKIIAIEGAKLLVKKVD